VNPRFIRQHLQRAEALGFHSAWVVEQICEGLPGGRLRGAGLSALSLGLRGRGARCRGCLWGEGEGLLPRTGIISRRAFLSHL
jgi:hypothetical protein